MNRITGLSGENDGRIFIGKTPREACAALLEVILDHAKTAASRPGAKPLSIAFSGGSTPAALFSLWREEYAARTPWQRLAFFQVDERCMPPGDPQSNFGLANRLLFSSLTASGFSPLIRRIDGEAPPETEARRYAALLKENLDCENGVPVFDFVLLGIGDDGHTSSIFPGLENLLDCEEPCAVSVNPYNASERVCLTGRPLIKAHRTFFLVTGEQKRAITDRILRPENSAVYPASWVWHKARRTQLFAAF